MSRTCGLAPLRNPIARLVVVFTPVLVLLAMTVMPGIAFEGTVGSTGLHDDAEVLTPEERAEIELAIEQVEAAGAPTVVYLRLLSTENDQAVEDGQALMEAWRVESAPGARDGFVMFFNLEPEDPDRGEFALVAGEDHFDDGALPQSELNRIRDEMIELLADDQMADGILLGLELTAERLEAGPPEPTAFETFLERVASGPLSLINSLGVLIALAIATSGRRIWRNRPHAGGQNNERTTDRPAEVHPALAGGLVNSRVDQTQVEATILELAKHGAIAFEPDLDDKKKVQIRIIDKSIGATEFEFRLLSLFAERAEDDVLDQNAISSTHAYWGQVQELMRDDLRSIGWFDPEATRRRMPLYLAGIVSLAIWLLYAVPLTVIEEPWVLIGGGVLVLVGAILIGAGTACLPLNNPRRRTAGYSMATVQGWSARCGETRLRVNRSG